MNDMLWLILRLHCMNRIKHNLHCRLIFYRTWILHKKKSFSVQQASTFVATSDTCYIYEILLKLVRIPLRMYVSYTTRILP